MTHRAATVIVTLETEVGTLVVLNAVDPRWRLDRDGRYMGVEAMSEGVLRPLPLAGLKFVGGLVDEGEDPARAALRELSEEAGSRLAQAVETVGLRPVYTMYRRLDWNAASKVEVTYFHSTLETSFDRLATLISPNDDCLAIVLVRPRQVVLGDDGYVVQGEPVRTFWREAYVPIPYADWNASPKAVEAMEAYETAGADDPFVGVDRNSLGNLWVPLYCPEDASPLAGMDAGDVTSGRPLPDGAILTYLMGLGTSPASGPAAR